MRAILFMAIAFLISLSFWCGINHGLKNCMDCGALEQQVIILKTANSSISWTLANEQRKTAAFQEVIKMNMGKK